MIDLAARIFPTTSASRRAVSCFGFESDGLRLRKDCVCTLHGRGQFVALPRACGVSVVCGSIMGLVRQDRQFAQRCQSLENQASFVILRARHHQLRNSILCFGVRGACRSRALPPFRRVVVYLTIGHLVLAVRERWQDKSAAVSVGANGCEDCRICAVTAAGLPSGAVIFPAISMPRALAALSDRRP